MKECIKCQLEKDDIQLNHHKNLQPLCSKVNRYIKKDILDFIL